MCICLCLFKIKNEKGGLMEKKEKMVRILFRDPIPRGFDPEITVPANTVKVENQQIFVDVQGQVLAFPIASVFGIIHFEAEIEPIEKEQG